MRMSRLFVQTLREAPGEIRLPGHQFLVRAGFLRPLFAGSYGVLPLGVQVRHRLLSLAQQALSRCDGQQVAMPVVQPGDFEPSIVPQGSVRFRDRNQHEMILGTGHQTAIVASARGTIRSYRQLPLFLYEVWQPFRNDARATSGPFAAREALVLDGYSFHAGAEDWAAFGQQVATAFAEMCERVGVPTLNAIADAGAEGGVTARQLVYPLASGSERVVHCAACGYAASQEVATARKEAPTSEAPLPMQDVETPDCKTIADLARFLGIPESRTAKAVFLVAGLPGPEDRFVFAIVRGDTDLSETKLKRALGATTLGPATEAEIRAAGAEPGYGSPVGLQNVTVVVDDLVAQSPNLVAGANRPGYHTLNVNLGRDYQATIVADIALAGEGSHCPECGSPMAMVQAVEVANLSAGGDAVSQEAGLSYLDNEGRAHPVFTGLYRLHLDRLLAAIAESHHDEGGLVWPAAAAPYHVYLMTVGKMSPEVGTAADRVYDELSAAGVDVLYDDRNERAGVKFNDADLLGLPLRVGIGQRGLENGTVEVKRRSGGDVEAIPLAGLIDYIKQML